MSILELILGRFFAFNKYIRNYNRISYFTKKIYDLIYNYSEEDLRIKLINLIDESANIEVEEKAKLRNVITSKNSYFIPKSEEQKLKNIDEICKILKDKIKNKNFTDIEDILDKLDRYSQINKLKLKDKNSEDNILLKKLFKIGDNIYRVISSKLFINIASIISATIALSTVTMGILPIISFAGTLLVIVSSVIYDIYQMKKHKSLIQEREYLKSIESIHQEKNILIGKSKNLKFLEDEEIKKEIKPPSKPSYIKSAIRIIKQKLPATTISLILQIATLNPISIAISFTNSVISHFALTLSRKDKDNVRYLIKEDIFSRKNKDFIPEYKNISELKSIYIRKKAESEVLKEIISENKSENKTEEFIRNRIETRIAEQKKDNISLFRKIVKYLTITLNPFYSEHNIARKIIDKIDITKSKDDEINNKNNPAIFSTLIDSIKHTSFVTSIVLGVEYILASAHINPAILTGMIFTTIASQTITSHIYSNNEVKSILESKPTKKIGNAMIKLKEEPTINPIGSLRAVDTPGKPKTSITKNK